MDKVTLSESFQLNAGCFISSLLADVLAKLLRCHFPGMSQVIPNSHINKSNATETQIVKVIIDAIPVTLTSLESKIVWRLCALSQ